MLENGNAPTRRRIIIAYDGSSNSKDALALGGQLCEALDAIPVVTYCVSFPKYLIDPLELGLALDEVARPVVEEASFRLDRPDVESRRLLDKSPARALHMLAEEIDPAAIVIGSAHSGLFGRVKTGSVGKQLLSGAPCPVAIAPRGYAEKSRTTISSICIALDEGAESERALVEATAMSNELYVPLRIISVMEPISYGSVPRAAMADLGLVQSRYTAQMLEEAAERTHCHAPVTIDRREGDPGPTLAEYSRGFDLMIVGSRGYGPLRRVLLGSVSSYLMNHAHSPLLITPRGMSTHLGQVSRVAVRESVSS